MGENGISCCLFLHQTTTRRRNRTIRLSCMSFVSYIKPQLQPIFCKKLHVVYRSFPTSNHNSNLSFVKNCTLYIVRFLHQTTTVVILLLGMTMLYIVRFLHQTTTCRMVGEILNKLYIVRFLHQTTTAEQITSAKAVLYIVRFLHQTTTVTYILFYNLWLYIVRFLHQTTTVAVLLLV